MAGRAREPRSRWTRPGACESAPGDFAAFARSPLSWPNARCSPRATPPWSRWNTSCRERSSPASERRWVCCSSSVQRHWRASAAGCGSGCGTGQSRGEAKGGVRRREMRESSGLSSKSMTKSSSRDVGGLHDAELIAVQHQVPGRIETTFRLESGASRRLILDGSLLFRITDFVSQNIVSRVVLLRGPLVDFRLVREKLMWVTSFSDSPCGLSPEHMQNHVDRIRANELSLVWVDPSRGAEMVAVAKQVSGAS
jgi:hypothetical protein